MLEQGGVCPLMFLQRGVGFLCRDNYKFWCLPPEAGRWFRLKKLRCQTLVPLRALSKICRCLLLFSDALTLCVDFQSTKVFF